MACNVPLVATNRVSYTFRVEPSVLGLVDRTRGVEGRVRAARLRFVLRRGLDCLTGRCDAAEELSRLRGQTGEAVPVPEVDPWQG